MTAADPGKDVDRLEIPYIAAGNLKLCSHFGKQFGNSPKSNSSKFRVSLWLSNSTLRSIPGELKTSVYTKTCTWLLRTGLLTTVKEVERAHVSIDWWQQTVPTREYFSAMKRNEILIHGAAWVNFESTMLLERSQPQQATFYVCTAPREEPTGSSKDPAQPKINN